MYFNWVKSVFYLTGSLGSTSLVLNSIKEQQICLTIESISMAITISMSISMVSISISMVSISISMTIVSISWHSRSLAIVSMMSISTISMVTIAISMAIAQTISMTIISISRLGFSRS